MASPDTTPLPRTAILLVASALVFTFALLAEGRAQNAPAELGIWFNDKGKGAVQIYRCLQDQSRLCGRIVWLKEKTNSKGQPLTDGRNPKASMRSRPICGLPVLGNLKRASGGGWNGGWVYDPEKGSAYTASVRAQSPQQLKLTGYKGIFFKSFIWKRAPADLPRCGELEPVEASAG